MKRLTLNFGIVVLFVLVIIVVNCHAKADVEVAPIDVIRNGTEQVLAILGQCEPGKHLKISAHREELRKIVSQYFDFDEMAVRVLGIYWKRQKPEDREEFKRLFKELLFRAYVDKYDDYECGSEEVLYEGQIIRGPYALVKTKIHGLRDRDTDVVVEYRLKKKKDGWKVYDVIVEGISLIQNYRSQFKSLLVKESFQSLLERMRKKLNIDKQQQQLAG